MVLTPKDGEARGRVSHKLPSDRLTKYTKCTITIVL